MASNKSPQSRFLGDLPMEGGITQKEKYRYVAHLMFFIGCALFSFGIWALSGFNEILIEFNNFRTYRLVI